MRKWAKNILPKLAVVLLFFSIASSAQYIFKSSFEGDPIVITVPNVVGQQQVVAEEIFTLLSLLPGNILNIASETVPSGEVISQNPPAGSMVTIYTTVNLNVSSGRAKVAVPNVVGLSLVTAGDAIVTANLKIDAVTGAESDAVPIDDVISQSPEAGTMVPPESGVDLVASVGPTGIVVPDVLGQVQASAESTIITATLTVNNVALANSNTVAEGYVISQIPGAGTLAAAGWPVDLVVSSGIGRTVTYEGPEPIDTTPLETLPVDETTGLPILLSIQGVDLLIDVNQKDPITGLAACMDWVLTCVDVESDRDLDDCALSVPACQTAEPWLESTTCCPDACYVQYSNERLAGDDPFKAFSDVYLQDTSCYPGMSELMQ